MISLPNKRARIKYFVWANLLQQDNYRRLKKILDGRKVKFICTQYPIQNIEMLKIIFPGKENIIFVDNEKIFKKAVMKPRYDDFFIDMFGGNFGHCIQKGNQLIAINVANVILREVFQKNN